MLVGGTEVNGRRRCLPHRGWLPVPLVLRSPQRAGYSRTSLGIEYIHSAMPINV